MEPLAGLHPGTRGHTGTPAVASPHPASRGSVAGQPVGTGPGQSPIIAQCQDHAGSQPSGTWLSEPEGPRNQTSVGHRLLIFLEKLGFYQVPLPQILPRAGVSPAHHWQELCRISEATAAARSPCDLHKGSCSQATQSPVSLKVRPGPLEALHFLPALWLPSFWFSFLFFRPLCIFFFFNVKDPV